MPQPSAIGRLARDIAALCVVALFLFPLLWWALASIKPMSARFDLAGNTLFGFSPTLANYALVLGGGGAAGEAFSWLGGDGLFDARRPFISSTVIAVLATALTLLVAAPAAYALSRMTFSGRSAALRLVLLQRALPPIAILIPIVYLTRDLGLYDTHAGVIIVHALVNLPIAVALLKSFLDDVPTEIDDAATIDGATRGQTFWRLLLPMCRGGVAAVAVLCFIFSWTEFLIALFLTSSIRTLPVKIATFGSSIGGLGGVVAALGTIAMLPAFVFIVLVQRHLVRGLSLGAMKD